MANNSTTNGSAGPAMIEVNGVLRPTSEEENNIRVKLLDNGGIQRIEAVMRQRLDSAGWSQNLREYVDRLLRSGTAGTYDEILNIVVTNIRSHGNDTVNFADGTPAPNLAIPDETKIDTAEVIKRELRQICKAPK